tara:strand:+ start:1136 stop:1276 length:141 start_codon:yes stop_codon:yes gene_type:complete
MDLVDSKKQLEALNDWFDNNEKLNGSKEWEAKEVEYINIYEYLHDL